MQGDFKPDSKALKDLYLTAWGGSMIATMSGVGPGNIFNTYLAVQNVQVQVSFATGVFCSMMVTFADTAQSIILGDMMIELMCWSLLANFFAMMLGMHLEEKLRSTYGRPSIPLMVITAHVALIGITMIGLQLHNIYQEGLSKALSWSSYC